MATAPEFASSAPPDSRAPAAREPGRAPGEKPRAFVATLPPGRGGVTSMLASALRVLAELGFEPVVGWYEPYSVAPMLSVPSYHLGRRNVGAESRQLAGAAEAWAIGAWFPELEVTTYRPTALWRERFDSCRKLVVVSGNCLPGRLFLPSRRPFLAWIATDWIGDRVDRTRTFPPLRRLFDRVVVRPLARRLERRVLAQGRILALSRVTGRELDRVARGPVVRRVVPQAIDVETFRPAADQVVPGSIGFVGRFDDPRKNFPLFLDALAAVREHRPDAQGQVIGGEPADADRAKLARRGLEGAVRFTPYLPPAPLGEKLRTLDIALLTSHQEGLGIAALEAMASGCPLIATRCGGPEDYVHDGANGFLTGFTIAEIAGRVAAVLGNRDLRHRLSLGARETVVREYSWRAVRGALAEEIAAI